VHINKMNTPLRGVSLFLEEMCWSIL